MNVLSFAGAHELGHILGLQHARQVDVSTSTNIMGYNSDSYLNEQEFAQRNSLIDFANQMGYPDMQPGFENEIDMLLRVLGSGTVMGV